MGNTISSYQIERLLGEGGMGKVYLGTDPRSGQKVAIKELYPEYARDRHLRLRFEREAMAMATLDHPNIVRFHEFLEQNGSLYLIMEYANGQTLEKYIARVTGPIPEARAVLLMEKILDAFTYAHDKGIVHRDIKPNNIIVTPDLNIKILDFGVAKLMNMTDIKLTTIGTVIGTSCYMSPEQAQGLTIDTRSDIYALGILLFQMVTGKPPYDAGSVSDIDIRLNIIRSPLPKAVEVYAYVSAHIQDVIDKATNKNMNLRFQDCREFAQALKAGKEGPADLNSENNKNMKTITIGRSSTCDIVINDPGVSRVHAEISLAGGQYVFRDVSTNGSVISGHKLLNERQIVVPDSRILLAGSIPLPWNKVLALLPVPHAHEEAGTVLKQPVNEPPVSAPSAYSAPVPENDGPVRSAKKDSLGVGWGLLAFFLPVAGWIMYFAWKNETPNRAGLAGLLGLIGFILNLIIMFSN